MHFNVLLSWETACNYYSMWQWTDKLCIRHSCLWD
jgi:hypothetical protein